jgi:adenine-specific DNA methylase
LENTPKIHGLSGVPKNIVNHSGFNSATNAKNSLIDLLKNANFGVVVFHYADDGLVSQKEIDNILKEYGKIEHFYIDSKGYTTKHVNRKVAHHIYFVENAKNPT